MDLGGLSDLRLSELQQYLGRMTFPTDKEEVASTAEGNDAPPAVVAQIRNSATERFSSPEEVLQAVPMVMNWFESMTLRAIVSSSSPSTITSSKGWPAPRATSGRRARHPPQPTPLVSSSHFAHPRWRRRPVVSSPGATVGRCCLLDARRSSGDAVRLRR